MKAQHKRYETVFIVNASLDDPQIDVVIEKTKEYIVKQGGEIQNVDKWGRKRLTYQIQKKNTGFFVLIYFSAAGDVISKLTRFYQLEEQIIRYLTIVLDKKAIKALEEKAAEKVAVEAATSEIEGQIGSNENLE